MRLLAAVLTGVVAGLHLYFLVLEMFLWQTPFGLKLFGMSPQVAADTSVLAMNQGLYNGFLAAGLIWSFFIPNPSFQRSVRYFFLSCIIVAGIFGGFTAKFSIVVIQALPALLAFIAVQRSPKLQD